MVKSDECVFAIEHGTQEIRLLLVHRDPFRLTVYLRFLHDIQCRVLPPEPPQGIVDFGMHLVSFQDALQGNNKRELIYTVVTKHILSPLPVHDDHCRFKVSNPLTLALQTKSYDNPCLSSKIKCV